MIVSGTWWKRVRGASRSLQLLPLVALGGSLSGCGLEALLLGRPSVQQPDQPLLPPRPDAGAQVDVGAGLSPLPSPQQVLTAVPFGRSDPFRPLVSSESPSQPVAAAAPSPAAAAPARGAAPAGQASSPAANRPALHGGPRPAADPAPPRVASRPMPLQPPAGFQLTGVIRSGARGEALVSYGPVSGRLRPGDRGGRTTELLPPGWTLASIQFSGPSPVPLPSITLIKDGRRVKVTL